MAFILKYGKVFGILAGLLTLFGTLLTLKSHYISVGEQQTETRIRSEQTKLISEATQKAISDTNKKVTEALAKQQKLFALELARVASERKTETIIKKVTEYVEKTPSNPKCTDLGPDFTRMLNKAIDSVNGPN